MDISGKSKLQIKLNCERSMGWIVRLFSSLWLLRFGTGVERKLYAADRKVLVNRVLLLFHRGRQWEFSRLWVQMRQLYSLLGLEYRNSIIHTPHPVTKLHMYISIAHQFPPATINTANSIRKISFCPFSCLKPTRLVPVNYRTIPPDSTNRP